MIIFADFTRTIMERTRTAQVVYPIRNEKEHPVSSLFFLLYSVIILHSVRSVGHNKYLLWAI